jgi:hypothetical protein
MTILRLTTKVAGLAANISGVTLADAVASPTYGVRRTDTGEIVVPAGTAVPNVAVGIYEYECADLPGVPYEYHMVAAYAGRTALCGGSWTAQVEPPAPQLILTEFDELLIANREQELAQWGEPVTVHPIGGADRLVTGIVTRSPPVLRDRPREPEFPLLVALPNDSVLGISAGEWNDRFELTIQRFRGSATARVRTVKPLHQDAALITWGCR